MDSAGRMCNDWSFSSSEDDVLRKIKNLSHTKTCLYINNIIQYPDDNDAVYHLSFDESGELIKEAQNI